MIFEKNFKFIDWLILRTVLELSVFQKFYNKKTIWILANQNPTVLKNNDKITIEFVPAVLSKIRVLIMKLPPRILNSKCCFHAETLAFNFSSLAPLSEFLEQNADDFQFLTLSAKDNFDSIA